MAYQMNPQININQYKYEQDGHKSTYININLNKSTYININQHMLGDF